MKVRFKTIEEYDMHIKDIENKLVEFKNFVNNHPEKLGVQNNYKLLITLRDELKNEKSKFISELDLLENKINSSNQTKEDSLNVSSVPIKTENINVHISGKKIINSTISSKLLISIIKSFEDVNVSIAKALEHGITGGKLCNNKIRDDLGFNIKAFSAGSFMITFSSKCDENQTTFIPSLNKLSFDKLCEIIGYNANLNEIEKQLNIIGSSSIIKYKEFIKVISDNKLDMIITEGKSSNPKVDIDSKRALTIYNGLKKFEEDNVKIEQIVIEGSLYYINTDRKTCGIMFFDNELDKIKKISSINFREGLKSQVKNHVDSEVKVTLEKTIKFCSDEHSDNFTYDLIKFH